MLVQVKNRVQLLRHLELIAVQKTIVMELLFWEYLIQAICWAFFLYFLRYTIHLRTT